jgi:hypothetical protein
LRETSFRKGYDLGQRTQEMRVTGLELGLHLNFGSELMKNRIVRFVNGLDEWLNALTLAFHRTHIKPEAPE